MASSEAHAISSPYQYAVDNGIKTWEGALAEDELFADTVVKKSVDIIVSLRFPFIFRRKIIEAPKLGAFNLHTGILPQYAGANVGNWAIYNGEAQHGVTLHKMEGKIDTGPVVEQVRFDIEDNDTGLTLTKKSITLGISLITQFLDNVAEGRTITTYPQNLEQRKYYPSSTPQQGRIDWKDKAQMIFNFIRACDYYPFQSPWGTPYTTLKSERIFICKCTITDKPCKAVPGSIRIMNREVEVATGDYWLQLDLIKYRENFVKPGIILKDGTHL